MPLTGGFDALRKSMQQGPVAKPVHHTQPKEGANPIDPTEPYKYAPEDVTFKDPNVANYYQQRDALRSKIEKMNPSSPYYDNYLDLLQQYDQDIARIEKKHNVLGEKEQFMGDVRPRVLGKEKIQKYMTE